MNVSKSNIILIGMAGCGKSVIGRMLADKLARDFIDTDTMIKQTARCPLQDLIDTKGLLEFRQVEEGVLLGLNLSEYVISTGGSSVYSHKGMIHLKENGFVIFLDVELPVLEKRIHNMDSRGLVKEPRQSFSELFIERRPLYKQYCDISISCSEMDPQELCRTIISKLKIKKNFQ